MESSNKPDVFIISGAVSKYPYQIGGYFSPTKQSYLPELISMIYLVTGLNLMALMN